MEIGLGVLGLSPAEFWSMTMRELGAALEGRLGGGSAEPLSRGRLEELARRYPDSGQLQQRQPPTPTVRPRADGQC